MIMMTAAYARKIAADSIANAGEVYNAIFNASKRGKYHVYISFTGDAKVLLGADNVAHIEGYMSEPLLKELTQLGYRVMNDSRSSNAYTISWENEE